MEKKVLLLLGDFAEDYEVMVPYQILQYAGIEPHCVAPDRKPGETIKTAIHDFVGDATYIEREGHRFYINADFHQLQLQNYDGLFITGGRAPEYLRLQQRVLDIVQYFFQVQKPVAAICHGIQVLTAADVVRGRRLTCYPAVAPEVKQAGGTYIPVAPEEAYVDGMLVTSPAWPGVAALMAEFIPKL